MEIFLERFVVEVLFPMLGKLILKADADPKLRQAVAELVVGIEQAKSTAQVDEENRKLHDLQVSRR